MAWPRDADGWTVFTPTTGSPDPADDTWVYYVDVATGDDGTAAGYRAGEAVVGGDPFNPGGSPNTYATINAALADAASRFLDGGSNWILIRRGGRYDETLTVKFAGASRSKPCLIGAYGTGDRPMVTRGLSGKGSGTVAAEFRNIAVVGINFYDTRKDSSHPDWAGYPTSNVSLGYLGVGNTKGWSQEGDPIMSNLLFEDCRFKFVQVGFQYNTPGAPAATGLEVRRSGLGPSYSIDSAHQQCMFADNCEGILIEDVVTYSGGWTDDPVVEAASPGGGHNADIFSRNYYFTGSCPGAVFRNVISSKSASTSIQARAGGDVEYCYHDRNPMGVLFGSNQVTGPLSASSLIDNVFTDTIQNGISSFRDCLRIAEATDFGTGGGTTEYPTDDVTVSGNIMAPATPVGDAWNAIYLAVNSTTWAGSTITITNNVIYDFGDRSAIGLGPDAGYPDVVIGGNEIHMPTANGEPIATAAPFDGAGWSFTGDQVSSGRPAAELFSNNGTPESLEDWNATTGGSSVAVTPAYTDPARNLTTYAESLGYADADEFLDAALDNNRHDGWDWRLTSYAAVDHVREGFDKPALAGGNVSPVYTAWRDGVASSALVISAGGLNLVLGVA